MARKPYLPLHDLDRKTARKIARDLREKLRETGVWTDAENLQFKQCNYILSSRQFIENELWIQPDLAVEDLDEDERASQTNVAELQRFAPLNRNQVEIVNDYDYQLETKGEVGQIVLKPRKQGTSTLYEALLVLEAHRRPGLDGVVIAHNDETSQYIYGITRRFFENLDPTWTPLTNTSDILKSGTTIPLVYRGRSHPSKITIGTAGTKTLKIGTTTDFVHCTEFAYWPDAEAVYTLMRQSLRTRGSICIIESTGEPGSFFEDLWKLARKGKIPMTPLFAPWYYKTVAILPLFKEHEYGLFPVEVIGESGDILDYETFREEELDIYQRYRDDGMTWEHLNWRRFCLMGRCSGRMINFKKLYPLTEEEAFLSKVTSVYPMTLINELEREAESARAVEMEISPDLKKLNPYSGRAVKVEGSNVVLNAPILCWVPPEEGGRYVVFCDPSEGTVRGDWSVVDAWKLPVRGERVEQVAQWRGRVDEGRVAEICFAMSNYYNHAPIVPEVNKSGVLVVLKNRMRGANLWPRPREDTKIKWGTPTDYGWSTNTRTKPLMVNFGVECVIRRVVKINSQQTLREMKDYMEKAATERGHPQYGPSKGNDDCVDCYQIMAATHGHIYIRKTQVPTEEDIRERMFNEARFAQDAEAEIWYR